MRVSRTAWVILFLFLTAGGLRFVLLDRRPMHTDEAVQAAQLGRLLEEGVWRYNPAEFHGSTLLYAALIPARLAGRESLDQLNEPFLRAVPAVFGLLLVFLPLLFADVLGRRAMLFAVLLLAFSPAFVFYSRYYIMEIPFVFFLGASLAALWKHSKKPSALRAACVGLFFGLAAASKETWIFALAAALSAGLMTTLLCPSGFIRQREKKTFSLKYLAAFFLPFAVVWVLFYTAFGAHPQGLADSLRAFALYPLRAAGTQGHAHPWWYYLDLLTWTEFIERPMLNEDIIVVFAVFGLFLLFHQKKGVRSLFQPFYTFLTLFAFILLAVYSAVPYKTPWNALSFLFAMALVAGVAIDRLIRSTPEKPVRLALWILVLVFAAVLPALQSGLMITRWNTSDANPYAYAHTGPDMLKMLQRVREIADRSPAGRGLYIQVIAPHSDYWPWPWYLRDFDNVGYDDRVDPAAPAAPVILADAQVEPDLVKRLYELPPPGKRDLYMPLFQGPMQLRPGIEWRGYVKKEFLDSLSETDVNVEQKAEEFHRFHHEAMHAMFEIFIDHPDSAYARQAARAAFDEIDRLEGLLSRFIPNSDVSRISRLKAGETATVSPETMECLMIARDVYERTNGVFDVTVGTLVDIWKNEDQPSPEQIASVWNEMGMENLELNPSDFTVGVLRDNLSVDLGGIGKGCAVDGAGRVLREWGIQRALIHGGVSSILALDPPQDRPGWKIRLSPPHDPARTIREVMLSNKAVSCSGLRRGSDMIDPTTGRPVQTKAAVWVRTETAALGDALSTAFMIMDPEEIKRYCENSEVQAILLPRSSSGESDHIIIGEW